MLCAHLLTPTGTGRIFLYHTLRMVPRFQALFGCLCILHQYPGQEEAAVVNRYKNDGRRSCRGVMEKSTYRRTPSLLLRQIQILNSGKVCVDEYCPQIPQVSKNIFLSR